MKPTTNNHKLRFTRRSLLGRAARLATLSAAGVATVRAAAGLPQQTAAQEHAQTQDSRPIIANGRIKQSLAYWCFNVAGEQWEIEQQAQIAQQLGCRSVELVEPERLPHPEEPRTDLCSHPQWYARSPFCQRVEQPEISR